MLEIIKVDTTNSRQVERFIRLPFRLYAGDPYWTPPLVKTIQKPGLPYLTEFSNGPGC